VTDTHTTESVSPATAPLQVARCRSPTSNPFHRLTVEVPRPMATAFWALSPGTPLYVTFGRCIRLSRCPAVRTSVHRLPIDGRVRLVCIAPPVVSNPSSRLATAGDASLPVRASAAWDQAVRRLRHRGVSRILRGAAIVGHGAATRGGAGLGRCRLSCRANASLDRRRPSFRRWGSWKSPVSVRAPRPRPSRRTTQRQR